MTYKDIVCRLKNASIEDAESEAVLLLEHYCMANRAHVFSFPDEDYSGPALAEAIKRRVRREPLQYILGEWGFFGESYFVDENCLIPRADTEILVEKAIVSLPHGARFADLCTGSGCIAISTLRHREDCSALALDLFPKTLELARKNARHNGVEARLSFRLADILRSDALDGEEPFDAILSNPPYIRTSVLPSLAKELKAEPRAALDGGEDGLVFYRAILEHHGKLLKENGFILFEIGFDQQSDLEALAAQYGYTAEIGYDLSGNVRTALLRKI
ncbi:MAG: peptide chain release factor N(5)-glutamine methyltransferase [Clostridia bacterium]|nr:peptide chain release factor N(5)-glutamine methyltransferase [Clostridia bacterium]